jgi:gliding motility-associated-like protein
VLPVNDPPVFNPIANQVATELTPLTFQLSAVDPEDSTLAFSSPNLPAGSNLIASGRNSATFTWVPPFGSRGVYNVTFIVREVFEANPLSDTVVVRITVNPVLPDLVAASLSISNTNVALNQTRVVTGVARCDIAPASTPFRLTFLQNDVVMKDTLVAGMALGQQISFSYLALFDRLGDHEIVFFVDFIDQVTESNEENNAATLRLRVTKGEVVVRPNPFTPNSDGFNDLAEFDFNEFRLQQPQLKIFKFNGALLTTLEIPVGTKFQWDGRDRSGREQQPGIYLYVLSDGNERVASGYFVLAR